MRRWSSLPLCLSTSTPGNNADRRLFFLSTLSVLPNCSPPPVCACDRRSRPSPPKLVVSSRASPQAGRGPGGGKRLLSGLMNGWMNGGVLPVSSSLWSLCAFEWQLRNCNSAPRTAREHHHSPVVSARCERDVSRGPVDIRHCSPQ